MKVVRKESLEGAPDRAWPQMAPVVRREEDFRPTPTGTNLIRALAHRHTVLDAQFLFEYFEAKQVARLSHGDALDEVPSLVLAADARTHLRLFPFGANGPGQKREQE